MELVAMPYWSDVVDTLRRRWPVLAVLVLCYLVWSVINKVENGRHLAALKTRTDRPVQFAFAELAALDRDVQRRFAVVPDRNFGMGRLGDLHSLYVPVTRDEKTTIAALQKKHLELTFYIMSRRTWRGEVSNAGRMPLQGPLYLTPSPAHFQGRVRNGVSSGERYLADGTTFAKPSGRYIVSPRSRTIYRTERKCVS